MNVLLIIAHGSRSKNANDEVGRLAQTLTKKSDTPFDRITHAFLEIAEPRIDAAIDEWAAEGASCITVFPYFLAGGTHVALDIPAYIKTAKKAFPYISFKILPHLGALDGIPALILQHVNSASATRVDNDL